MNERVNDQTWEKKLRAAVLAVYLDCGAPARFYIQDCIPCKMLEYIEPGMTEKYGAIALCVNVGEDDISLNNRDFVLFATNGIVAYSAAAVNFRAWDKLSQYYADNLPKNADEALCLYLVEQIAQKIAPSLVGKCPGLKETLVAVVNRALRALLGLETFPPAPLPYFSLPPEPRKDDKSATATPFDMATATTPADVKGGANR